MNELKRLLIRQAVELYKEIYPCSARTSLGDCFTTEEKRIMFWFNTSDKSTHVLTADMQEFSFQTANSEA
ncbi:MAG: hypothetical protein GX089_10760 [Fibrobacter sp.]|jgi:hypothetical protein|nr:hypothetical protein [Fibrobacter sp.]